MSRGISDEIVVSLSFQGIQADLPIATAGTPDEKLLLFIKRGGGAGIFSSHRLGSQQLQSSSRLKDRFSIFAVDGEAENVEIEIDGATLPSVSVEDINIVDVGEGELEIHLGPDLMIGLDTASATNFLKAVRTFLDSSPLS